MAKILVCEPQMAAWQHLRVNSANLEALTGLGETTFLAAPDHRRFVAEQYKRLSRNVHYAESDWKPMSGTQRHSIDWIRGIAESHKMLRQRSAECDSEKIAFLSCSRRLMLIVRSLSRRAWKDKRVAVVLHHEVEQLESLAPEDRVKGRWAVLGRPWPANVIPVVLGAGIRSRISPDIRAALGSVRSIEHGLHAEPARPYGETRTIRVGMIGQPSRYRQTAARLFDLPGVQLVSIGFSLDESVRREFADRGVHVADRPFSDAEIRHLIEASACLLCDDNSDGYRHRASGVALDALAHALPLVGEPNYYFRDVAELAPSFGVFQRRDEDWTDSLRRVAELRACPERIEWEREAFGIDACRRAWQSVWEDS